MLLTRTKYLQNGRKVDKSWGATPNKLLDKWKVKMGGCGVLPQAIGKISWHGRRSPRRACHVRATGSNGPHKAVLKTAGFLATLSVIASPVQSNAEELTIKFPASPIPEVRKSQGSMVEAWAYASIEFFDPSLNGLGLDGWKAALKRYVPLKSGRSFSFRRFFRPGPACKPHLPGKRTLRDFRPPFAFCAVQLRIPPV